MKCALMDVRYLNGVDIILTKMGEIIRKCKDEGRAKGVHFLTKISKMFEDTKM